MFKKPVFALILILLMIVAGCSPKTTENNNGAEENQTATEEKATDLKGSEITLMVPEWAVPTDEMLNQFTEETGISVVVNAVAWDDIKDKVSVAAVGQTAPADVVEVDWSWVGEFAAADWLEPLELSQDTLSDIPTLDSFTADGKVLAIPYYNDFRIAYMNNSQFEKAGVTEAPNSWNQLIEDAKKIKESGTNSYPIALPIGAEENSTTTFLWLTYSRNGVVFNEDNTLNKEATLDTLNLVNNLVNKDGLVDPALKSGTGGDAYKKIVSGEASYMIGPTSYVTSVNDEKESKVVGQVTPILLPGMDGEAEHTVAFTEAIGVTKYSENKEAAKEFVKWYSSKDTQLALNENIHTMPTRNSALESLAGEGKFGEAADTFIEQAKRIKSPFPNGVPEYYTEMSTTIFNAINNMVLEKITPEEAFEQMNSKVNELAGK